MLVLCLLLVSEKIRVRGFILLSKKKILLREEVVENNLCSDCKSMCCYDLTMEIDRPKTKEDLNKLKWFLHFKHSYIFIYQKKWYHLIKSECRYLDKTTFFCKNYKDRVDMCRKHNPPQCERYSKWYDYMFSDKDVLDSYVRKNKLIKFRKNKK